MMDQSTDFIASLNVKVARVLVSKTYTKSVETVTVISPEISDESNRFSPISPAPLAKRARFESPTKSDDSTMSFSSNSCVEPVATKPRTRSSVKKAKDAKKAAKASENARLELQANMKSSMEVDPTIPFPFVEPMAPKDQQPIPKIKIPLGSELQKIKEPRKGEEARLALYAQLNSSIQYLESIAAANVSPKKESFIENESNKPKIISIEPVELIGMAVNNTPIPPKPKLTIGPAFKKARDARKAVKAAEIARLGSCSVKTAVTAIATATTTATTIESSFKPVTGASHTAKIIKTSQSAQLELVTPISMGGGSARSSTTSNQLVTTASAQPVIKKATIFTVKPVVMKATREPDGKVVTVYSIKPVAANATVEAIVEGTASDVATVEATASHTIPIGMNAPKTSAESDDDVIFVDPTKLSVESEEPWFEPFDFSEEALLELALYEDEDEIVSQKNELPIKNFTKTDVQQKQPSQEASKQSPLWIPVGPMKEPVEIPQNSVSDVPDLLFRPELDDDESIADDENLADDKSLADDEDSDYDSGKKSRKVIEVINLDNVEKRKIVEDVKINKEKLNVEVVEISSEATVSEEEEEVTPDEDYADAPPARSKTSKINESTPEESELQELGANIEPLFRDNIFYKIDRHAQAASDDQEQVVKKPVSCREGAFFLYLEQAEIDAQNKRQANDGPSNAGLNVQDMASSSSDNPEMQDQNKQRDVVIPCNPESVSQIMTGPPDINQEMTKAINNQQGMSENITQILSQGQPLSNDQSMWQNITPGTSQEMRQGPPELNKQCTNRTDPSGSSNIQQLNREETPQIMVTSAEDLVLLDPLLILMANPQMAYSSMENPSNFYPFYRGPPYHVPSAAAPTREENNIMRRIPNMYLNNNLFPNTCMSHYDILMTSLMSRSIPHEELLYLKQRREMEELAERAEAEPSNFSESPVDLSQPLMPNRAQTEPSESSLADENEFESSTEEVTDRGYFVGIRPGTNSIPVNQNNSNIDSDIVYINPILNEFVNRNVFGFIPKWNDQQDQPLLDPSLPNGTKFFKSTPYHLDGIGDPIYRHYLNTVEQGIAPVPYRAFCEHISKNGMPPGYLKELYASPMPQGAHNIGIKLLNHPD